MQRIFGSGQLFACRSDVAIGTPVRFGTLQDASLDFSFTEKELHGQNQIAVEIARGAGKITGKAKFARIQGLVFNDLFWGLSQSAQKGVVADAEAVSIPATPGPYTATVANGTTWVDDLGVVDATTYLPYTKVASAPATGQYSVAAGGIYTFAAADQGKAVQISYTYTAVSGGQKIVVTNQLMGTTPTFLAVLYGQFKGQQLVLKLHKCTASKLSLALKLEDWTIPEMDFSVMDDGSGNILTCYTVE